MAAPSETNDGSTFSNEGSVHANGGRRIPRMNYFLKTYFSELPRAAVIGSSLATIRYLLDRSYAALSVEKDQAASYSRTLKYRRCPDEGGSFVPYSGAGWLLDGVRASSRTPLSLGRDP